MNRDAMSLRNGVKISLRGNEKIEVVVNSLIGVGYNLFAYLVDVLDVKCVLKEFFPEGMYEKGLITRVDSSVRLKKTLCSWIEWKKEARRFVFAAKVAQQLCGFPNISSCIVKLRGCYRGNGTLYTLSLHEDGVAWDKLKNETIEHILSVCVSIASMTEEMHKLGWLMVDIKSSNYLVKDMDNIVEVRMVDFDSIVLLNKISKTSKFRCSPETAPKELMQSDNLNIGVHSDLCCIAKMLLLKLSDYRFEKDDEKTFYKFASAKLQHWSSTRQECLMHLISEVLSNSSYGLKISCGEFANKLRYINENTNWSNS
jgi:serine/threonine protein kinase